MKKMQLTYLLVGVLALASCSSLKNYPDDDCRHYRETSHEDYDYVSKTDADMVTERNLAASHAAAANGKVGWSDKPLPLGERNEAIPRNGLTLKKDGTTYTYPRESKCYKYLRLGMEAKVENPNAKTATLQVRSFPTKVKLGRGVQIESADVKAYPFATAAPAKQKGDVWTFEGEQKVNTAGTAMPAGKELYLKYKIKFCPTNRYKCKTSYRFKTRKVAK